MTYLKSTNKIRTADIIALYNLGWTLQKIGDKHGITRERVRQIMEKAGIPRRQRISFKPKPCVCGCGKMTPEKYNNRKYAKNCNSLRPQKISLELINQMPALYDSGLSFVAVGKKLGVSHYFVNYWLKKMNHPIRKRWHYKVSKDNRKTIVELYSQGCSMIELAGIHGVSESTIYNYLKKEG